jgi:GT2 family glycosyltransferase
MVTQCVIVVNWNSGPYLRKCLHAVLHQSVPIEKIIVVDNASTDASLLETEDLLPHVQLIQLPHNAGFAAGNNIAVKAAEGCEWIAFLNVDAFPEPDWLERLLAAAQSRPEGALFGSRMIQALDPERLDGVGDSYHVSGVHWRIGHGQNVRDPIKYDAEVFSVCGAAMLCRRDLFLEVGGFDESFFCYAEDVDLGFRLRLRGHRCWYVADSTVYHVGSATTGKRSDFAVYHGHRNLVWVYFKNMPGPLLWLYLPQHILLNFVSLIYFTAQGKGRVIFAAKWAALRGLPQVLREWRRVQQTRHVGAWEIRRAMSTGWLTPYLRGGLRKELLGRWRSVVKPAGRGDKQ